MDKEKLKELLSDHEYNKRLDKYLLIGWMALIPVFGVPYVLIGDLAVWILIAYLGALFVVYAWKYKSVEKEFIELAKKELEE